MLLLARIGERRRFRALLAAFADLHDFDSLLQEGDVEGALEGICEGAKLGISLGELDRDGSSDGSSEGGVEGTKLGDPDG